MNSSYSQDGATMDLSLRASLPFWGVGFITLLLGVCLCCFLKRLKSRGKEEQNGYKTITYSKLNLLKISTDTCPVCIEDYSAGEKVAVCRCKHVFHPKCLNQWLVDNNSCPMCKQAVNEQRARESTELVQHVVMAGV